MTGEKNGTCRLADARAQVTVTAAAEVREWAWKGASTKGEWKGAGDAMRCDEKRRQVISLRIDNWIYCTPCAATVVVLQSGHSALLNNKCCFDLLPAAVEVPDLPVMSLTIDGGGCGSAAAAFISYSFSITIRGSNIDWSFFTPCLWLSGLLYLSVAAYYYLLISGASLSEFASSADFSLFSEWC